MAEACRALDFPVVSGNVSLYNETKNEDGSSLAILPTPAIGGVGLLEDWEKSATIAFKGDGHAIWLMGGDTCHLGQSLWLDVCAGERSGQPPRIDLDRERATAELVRGLIRDGIANAAHDVSDGGVLVALAEMALAGGFGADIQPTDWHGNFAAQFFGEDQGRYIVCVPDNGDQTVPERARSAGVPCRYLGITGEGDLFVGDGKGAHNLARVSLADLRAAHEGFFPKLMGSELTPEF
jgi:phosphoribosylformylglycinamidine synthase